jgi:signal peptidase II
VVGLVAGAVVALDQLTKTLAERGLRQGPVHLLWTLQLNLTLNRGAAFSLAQGWAPVIVAVAVVLVALLLGMGRSMATMTGLVAIGLIVGGATGNLVDRLVRSNGGSVIDFIDLQWWPVFNLADAAVDCGAVLLVATGLRRARA